MPSCISEISVLYLGKSKAEGLAVIRFFVNPGEINGETCMLTGENAAHAKVLRIRPGEEILLCDGDGNEWICTAEENLQDGFLLKIQEQRFSPSEPKVFVSVYAAYSKGDKMEHVIQKATELGASEIVAFPSARCVSRPDSKSIQKKLVRWQKIAVSAAEQSGRGRIPRVTAAGSYEEALKRAAESDLGILFYENEHATTLRMALEFRDYTSVSLLTGPEGGFEEEEVTAAQKAGLRICTLGRRILRCETAPLCGLTAVMYAAGEF